LRRSWQTRCRSKRSLLEARISTIQDPEALRMKTASSARTTRQREGQRAFLIARIDS
jgi:hypothetical protein